MSADKKAPLAPALDRFVDLPPYHGDLPPELADWDLTLEEDGTKLRYVFVSEDEGIPALLAKLGSLGIAVTDLETHRSSLEDIFVDLVSDRGEIA